MGGNPACSGCKECDTTLATHPDLHRETEPHKFVQRFKASDGSRDKDLCVACMATREPIDETPTAEERYRMDGVRVE
jgi:hypothetical protein